MNKMKKNLIVLLTVIVVLFLISITACADSTEEENDTDGVWCYTPNTTDDFTKVSGHNYYSALGYESDWTGTFTGASEDFGMVVMHSPGVKRSSGRALFIGTVSFASVDVDGTSGGLEMYVSGERVNNISDTDWEGNWVITSGTGALEDLRGQGTWWGPGWQGNYSDCGVIYYSVEDLDFEPE